MRHLDEEVSRPQLASLHADVPIYNYKGEESLKHLDIPAYVRRNTANPQPITVEHPEEEEPLATKRRVRRLNADDLKDRSERIRSEDSDTPAFLRKMLD